MKITSINDQPATAPKPIYKPYGNVLFLDYVPPAQVGKIHLPNGAKPLHDFITCVVTAAGPACDLVKVGDQILLATKAIMGVRHDGHEAWMTQENTILAVVEDGAKLSPRDMMEKLRKEKPASATDGI